MNLRRRFSLFAICAQALIAAAAAITHAFDPAFYTSSSLLATVVIAVIGCAGSALYLYDTRKRP